ncbi:hypothetical protein [Desulforhopalus singaporensis]|uniref:hypothetical protein n=1 Tax=Desulforhopalus singaporensis TaxID=91360 RepID=UPI000B89B47D|nr:hypothetical protein [Desulforhopalus singaporensis]
MPLQSALVSIRPPCYGFPCEARLLPDIMQQHGQAEILTRPAQVSHGKVDGTRMKNGCKKTVF